MRGVMGGVMGGTMSCEMKALVLRERGRGLVLREGGRMTTCVKASSCGSIDAAAPSTSVSSASLGVSRHLVASAAACSTAVGGETRQGEGRQRGASAQRGV